MMKMSLLKQSKNCFYGTHLCVLFILMTYVVLLVHVYDHRQNNFYQQDLVMNLNMDGGMNSSDKDTKLKKANYKPVDAHVQDIKSFWQKQNLLHKPDRTTKKQTNATTDHVKRPLMEAVSHVKERQTNTLSAYLGINSTHVNGILMEPINAKLLGNVYFTIKTTHKYYRSRLLPLMLTWLQAVDKYKVAIITERSDVGQSYVDLIRKAGYHVVDTSCLATHDYPALSCKLANEFIAYYKAVEDNPHNKEGYQWFCHCDDDMYINIPQLSQLLQQFDPHKPYYVGKWPRRQRKGLPYLNLKKSKISHFTQMNYTLKKVTYQYATGAAFCISYTLMMEGKKFFNGVKAFKSISAESRLPDDMTVGFIIGILLGYNLTETNNMTNQGDTYVNGSSLNELTKFITVSSPIITNDGLKKITSLLKQPLPPDPTKPGYNTKFMIEGNTYTCAHIQKYIRNYGQKYDGENLDEWGTHVRMKLDQRNFDEVIIGFIGEKLAGKMLDESLVDHQNLICQSLPP